MSIHF